MYLTFTVLFQFLSIPLKARFPQHYMGLWVSHGFEGWPGALESSQGGCERILGNTKRKQTQS